jgi:putative restriction endonuclease
VVAERVGEGAVRFVMVARIPVLLELAATQSGFDVPTAASDGWMGFASTQCPLRVWLSATSDEGLVAALSMRSVGDALAAEAVGTTTAMHLPNGAVVARAVGDRSVLQRLLRRAWQLSRTLPSELLRVFEAKTVELPRSTEAERWVVQRVGQDLFRDGLLEYWDGCCAVTGLCVRDLLRASHIKPWADCATDAERLDVFNGLLLAPQLDAVFDKGFITVADDGAVVVSARLDAEARCVLGLDATVRVRRLEDGHRVYLAWHRTKVWR